MRTVFISYRRQDSQMAAGRLNRELKARFGGSRVFRDKEAIGGGRNWREEVDRALSSETTVIALIGPAWRSENEGGERRLDQINDPTRRELELALERRARVIPVLVDAARIPEVHELPSSLLPLRDLNFMRLRDDDWESDIRRLLDTVEESLELPWWFVRPRTRIAIAVSALLTVGMIAGIWYWWIPPAPAAEEAIEQSTIEIPGSRVSAKQIRDRVLEFQNYLERVGFTIPPGTVGVQIEPGERLRDYQDMASVYDPEKQAIVVASDYADDLNVMLREYAHHVLMGSVGRVLSPPESAIESGLATYFACSRTNHPILGDRSAAARKKVFSPHRLTKTREFEEIDLGDVGSVQRDGSEIWGGAFWSVRMLLGGEAADKLLLETWTTWDPTDGHRGFADFLDALIKTNAAQGRKADSEAIRESFAIRGLSVEPSAAAPTRSLPTETKSAEAEREPAWEVQTGDPDPVGANLNLGRVVRSKLAATRPRGIRGSSLVVAISVEGTANVPGPGTSRSYRVVVELSGGPRPCSFVVVHEERRFGASDPAFSVDDFDSTAEHILELADAYVASGGDSCG